jgi:endonuclease III
MRITKKIKEQIRIENRIAELRATQRQEVENNFANNNLWDECEDLIYMLIKYGQETMPVYNEMSDDYVPLNYR